MLPFLVASNNSMASRDSDGGSDGGDHSVMDHQIQEVKYYSGVRFPDGKRLYTAPRGIRTK